MKGISFWGFIACIICFSCNRNPLKAPDIPRVGNFDSSAIAGDTVMQRNLEGSYEYAKTLNISPQLAYDVRAYGGAASEGDYAILRRTGSNLGDTIVQGKREGTFANAFAGDLNGDGKEEIYIIAQSTGTGAYGNVIAWEFDKTGKATSIHFPDPSQSGGQGYMGKDSFFINGYFLVRRFPVYKENDSNCCPSGGHKSVYYQLKNDRLEEVKSELEK